MKEQFRRRHLPHWDLPGATYFVTACLAGSIPAEGLLSLRAYSDQLNRRSRPVDMSPRDWETQKWKLLFARGEEWLDCRPAVRHFEDRRLAMELRMAIYHFAGDRYDLFSYVIMPSHFHWVFRPREEWVASLGSAADQRSPRQRIMHSIKRHASHQCNPILGQEGAFWQEESYDHCVRDDAELQRICDYVELNPVKAGLAMAREEWPFSSAHDCQLAQVNNLWSLTKAELAVVQSRLSST